MVASAEWKHLGISCVSIWNWKQKVRGPILDQNKVGRGGAELCLRVCFTTIRKDDASSKENVKQNLISPQVMLWVRIYTVTSHRLAPAESRPLLSHTTYLPRKQQECTTPQSMALSLVLAGKSHQVWKPGVLLRGEKKESVCNKEKALDQNVISPLCF